MFALEREKGKKEREREKNEKKTERRKEKIKYFKICMYYIAIYSDSIYFIISVFPLSLPIYCDRTELIAKESGVRGCGNLSPKLRQKIF